MALTSSDTNVSTLVVNKCTKEQYDAMASHSGDELYVVNEDIDSTPRQDSPLPVSSGGVYARLAELEARIAALEGNNSNNN